MEEQENDGNLQVEAEDEFEDQPIGEPKAQQPAPTPMANIVTASGRVSQPPAWLNEEMGEAALTAAEQNYYYAHGELQEK